MRCTCLARPHVVNLSPHQIDEVLPITTHRGILSNPNAATCPHMPQVRTAMGAAIRVVQKFIRLVSPLPLLLTVRSSVRCEPARVGPEVRAGPEDAGVPGADFLLYVTAQVGSACGGASTYASTGEWSTHLSQQQQQRTAVAAAAAPGAEASRDDSPMAAASHAGGAANDDENDVPLVGASRIQGASGNEDDMPPVAASHSVDTGSGGDGAQQVGASRMPGARGDGVDAPLAAYSRVHNDSAEDPSKLPHGSKGQAGITGGSAGGRDAEAQLPGSSTEGPQTPSISTPVESAVLGGHTNAQPPGSIEGSDNTPPVGSAVEAGAGEGKGALAWALACDFSLEERSFGRPILGVINLCPAAVDKARTAVLLAQASGSHVSGGRRGRVDVN